MSQAAKIALMLFTTGAKPENTGKALDFLVAGGEMSQATKIRVERFLDRLAAAS